MMRMRGKIESILGFTKFVYGGVGVIKDELNWEAIGNSAKVHIVE